MESSISPSYKPSLGERFLVNVFHFVNKFIAWHKLPSIVGALNLDALRVELRQYNLHDGYSSGTLQGNQITEPITDKRFEYVRNSDGKFNSTEMPLMGCAGMRFGRNFPRTLTPKPTEDELWNPSPRMLSERFMARKKFIPATTLNLLAAAWIQFQTHDWFFHESVRYFLPCLALTYRWHMLTAHRVTKTMKSLSARVTTGHTAKWSYRVRNRTKSCTTLIKSAQDTRTSIQHGGTAPKSMGLAKLQRSLSETCTVTESCCLPRKAESNSFLVTLTETHSPASTTIGG